VHGITGRRLSWAILIIRCLHRKSKQPDSRDEPIGQGCSFEALRAKILFSEGAHKIVHDRPKFERKSNDRELLGYALNSPSTQDEENTKKYGAEISTLATLIEADKL
jgi:hypothetical protein